MTTGPLWDLTTDPTKPECSFDPQAKRDIPWDWATWLAALDSATTIATKSFSYPLISGVAVNPMLIESSVIVTPGDEVVLARVTVDPGLYVEATHKKKLFPITCHVVTADGQEEDQTLWFRLESH